MDLIFYNTLKNIIISTRVLAGGFWHVGCIRSEAGLGCNSFALGALKMRRLRVPETPRLAGCGATSPLFFYGAQKGYWRVSATIRRIVGKKLSKSTGFATCRSNPAAMAAAASPFEA